MKTKGQPRASVFRQLPTVLSETGFLTDLMLTSAGFWGWNNNKKIYVRRSSEGLLLMAWEPREGRMVLCLLLVGLDSG